MIAEIFPVFGIDGERSPLTAAKRAIGCGCGADEVLTLKEFNQSLYETDVKLNELITAQNTQALVTITTSGLARDGGNLTANRVIDVPKATPAECVQGILDDVAVTPLGLNAGLTDLQNRMLAGAQLSLDTLVEIATALGNDPSFSNSIYAALNNEAVTRANADTAEAAARSNADNALQANIANETNARAAADNALNANKADKTITIIGAGLAQDGGDLSANRVINVPKASQSEAIAGVDDTKAVTPLGLKAAQDDLQNRIVGGAQISLDTLMEIAAALGNDPNLANSLYAALNSEAVTRANNDTAETNARIAADNAEAAARANADTNLLNLINTMQTQMTAMQNQINLLTPLSGEVSP